MPRILIDRSSHWFTKFASPTSETAHYIEIGNDLHKRFTEAMHEFDIVQHQIHQEWCEQQISRTKANA